MSSAQSVSKSVHIFMEGSRAQEKKWMLAKCHTCAYWVKLNSNCGVTDGALYIGTSHVYQMLKYWQQCMTQKAFVVKLNVVEHKFTQPHQSKDVQQGSTNRNKLLLSGSSSMHRIAGISAPKPHGYSSVAWLSSSLSVTAAGIHFCDTHSAAPSCVKSGKIIHISCNFPAWSLILWDQACFRTHSLSVIQGCLCSVPPGVVFTPASLPPFPIPLQDFILSHLTHFLQKRAWLGTFLWGQIAIGPQVWSLFLP